MVTYKTNTAKLIAILCLAILFVFSTGSYALPFNVATKAGTQLPTNVVVGSTATAYYTVKNNTAIQRNSNYVLSLPKNVTQVTSGGTYSDTCGATFNLAPVGEAGDTCTLQLLISGPVSPYPAVPSLFVCFPGGTTCAGPNDQLHVTSVSTATLNSITIKSETTPIIALGTTEQYTAIGTYSDNSTADLTMTATWLSSNPTVATITTTGLATGLVIGSTEIRASSGSISNTSTLHVVATPIVVTTLNVSAAPTNGTFNIIFTQSGIGVQVVTADLPSGLSFVDENTCTVNPVAPICSLAVNTGTTPGTYTITPEILAGSASISSSPDPLTMTVSRPLFSYVSDTTNILYQCPINPANGSFSGDCVPLTNSGTSFSNTSGVGFNTFSSQNYAYVGDSSDTLWQCPLTSGGEFSAACTGLTNTGTAFSSTRHTTFATFSGTTYAYVSDDSTYLWKCPMNTATGGFSGACTGLTNPFFLFPEIFNATFATYDGTTYAYLGDHSFVVWQCPMNDTGDFSGECIPLGTGIGPFTSTLGVTFQTFNGTTYGYVADNSNLIWQCSVNLLTGRFESCVGLQNDNTAFFRTSSINFKTFADVVYAYVTDETSSLWQCPMDS